MDYQLIKIYFLPINWLHRQNEDGNWPVKFPQYCTGCEVHSHASVGIIFFFFKVYLYFSVQRFCHAAPFLTFMPKYNFIILDLNSVLDGLISKSNEAGGPVRYSCLTCGKSMADKAKMRRHAEVHLDMNHPCIVCGKNFKTRNALSIHYTRYHGQEVVSPWTTSWNIFCPNFSFN